MVERNATVPGLRVPRGRGEEARKWLKERDLLVPGLRFKVSGDALCLPLRPGADLKEVPFPADVIPTEFAPLPRPDPRTYQDLVTLPPELHRLLPRAFDIVGDIVIIRLPPRLHEVAPQVGAALLTFVPGCRLVGQDRGVHGPSRTRDLLPLAGRGDWQTIHHENGLSFRVDLSRVYFSPRLAREHDLIAKQTEDGEEVLDLFCGLGPFALTILKRRQKAKVTAVDSNPEAISLLQENARRLAVPDRLLAVQEDADSFLRRPGSFHRAIANLPHEGYKYASSVANLVRPGGHLHIYEVALKTGVSPVQARMDALRAVQGVWTLLDRHVVHGYSATEDLFGLHFQRGQ